MKSFNEKNYNSKSIQQHEQKEDHKNKPNGTELIYDSGLNMVKVCLCLLTIIEIAV